MTFGNSILAGEDLVRTGMRSPNYAPGVSGWRVAQDGSAEFNNVVVRGQLLVSNGNAHVHIYNPGGAPTVEYADSSGYTWNELANLNAGVHFWGVGPSAIPSKGLSLLVDGTNKVFANIGVDEIDLTAPTIRASSAIIGPGFTNSTRLDLTAPETVINGAFFVSQVGGGVRIQAANGGWWLIGVSNTGVVQTVSISGP